MTKSPGKTNTGPSVKAYIQMQLIPPT